MQPFNPETNQHPEITTVGQTTVGPAPTNMQKLCNRYNLHADQHSNPFQLSVCKVTRPGGMVNYHVRLDGPGTARLVWSMATSDDESTMKAIHELLGRAKAPAWPF